MKESHIIQITETPRDAMQGLTRHIPATVKAEYINALLKVGFDKVDVGSFVSPKSVPQMADTVEVFSLLIPGDSHSKIMVIVGNTRGGLHATEYPQIEVIGFPYSISPTFLRRNLNTTPIAAWKTLQDLFSICNDSGMQLQVYLAMAFGNPYGDPWDDELVLREAIKLRSAGIKNLAFSDITGEGTPESIGRLCSKLVDGLPSNDLSIHLHSSPHDWQPKVEAAWQAGIRNFEGALGGYGGCPMTGYELLGNLDTAKLVDWCNMMNIPCNINESVLKEAKQIALQVFG